MSRNLAEERKLIEAVDRFAQLMKAKLVKKARAGYSGWDDASPYHLTKLFWEHLEKGDPVDLANFLMMLECVGYGVQVHFSVDPIVMVAKAPEKPKPRQAPRGVRSPPAPGPIKSRKL